MSSAAENGGIAGRAGGSDAVEVLGRLLAAGDPGGTRADVDAGLQQGNQFVDAGPQRVVTACVRLEGDQCVDVIGRRNTGRRGPAGELGGIDADLVGAVGVHPDEFHIVAADDGVQGAGTDVSGGPLDDAEGIAHG